MSHILIVLISIPHIIYKNILTCLFIYSQVCKTYILLRATSDIYISGESDNNPVAKFKERNKAESKAQSKDPTQAKNKVDCCHPSYFLIFYRKNTFIEMGGREGRWQPLSCVVGVE